MRFPAGDTNPKVEKILIELIRGKNVSERISKVFELSAITRKLSMRAITRSNPGLDKSELKLIFIKHQYGDDMFNKVKSYYTKSKND